MLRRILIGRHPARTLARAGLLALVSIGVFGFLLLPIRLQGISMLPTYRAGGFNLVNTLAYRWSPPKRGDMVAIRLAGRHVMLVKRIVALPGERIRIADGIVYVNGAPLEEPYVRYRAAWSVLEMTLDQHEYFFIGDNRGMPQQSHEFGRAPRERIVGKVMF